MSSSNLSLEERLTIQEELLKALLYGAFLDNPTVLRQTAAVIQTNLDAAAEREQDQASPWLKPATRDALQEIADALAEIDNYPDFVKQIARRQI